MGRAHECWPNRNRFFLSAAVLAAGAGPGCDGSGTPTTAPASVPALDEIRKPALPSVSWDTERDHQFAGYLQKHSGGLIKEAAVGLEKKGTLRVEVSRAVKPEDTLALTKSLMSGARKDYPDRPLTLSVYDPSGAPVLTAQFRPGHGVHYKIAHGGDTLRMSGDAPKAVPPVADAIARGGVTARDQAFAKWAEEHSRSTLRYVEADLERHGRLWFGVTREVAPTDVKPLTKSLLEGAHKEFPGREPVATVFDPEGERIGRARLSGDGTVHWE